MELPCSDLAVQCFVVEIRAINRIDSIPMSDIQVKIFRVISGQKIGNSLMSCHALWCPITKNSESYHYIFQHIGAGGCWNSEQKMSSPY